MSYAWKANAPKKHQESLEVLAIFWAFDKLTIEPEYSI